MSPSWGSKEVKGVACIERNDVSHNEAAGFKRARYDTAIRQGSGQRIDAAREMAADANFLAVTGYTVNEQHPGVPAVNPDNLNVWGSNAIHTCQCKPRTVAIPSKSYSREY